MELSVWGSNFVSLALSESRGHSQTETRVQPESSARTMSDLGEVRKIH